MRHVTVLLSGVPKNMTLIDLGYNLDKLLDTDEIGTFGLRNLPDHLTRRQIAVDFRSGFEAIAAQERLHGYTYELPNGREFTMSAKITRMEKYMRSKSLNPEPSWQTSRSPKLDKDGAMASVPSLSEGALFRAHAKLDAQWELLKKQKRILHAERELLREKIKLKREYSLTNTIDSDDGTAIGKRRRYCSASRNIEISRSRSGERNSRSKSRELKICTRKQRSKLRELRSRSRDHEAKMEVLENCPEEVSKKETVNILKPSEPGSRSKDREAKLEVLEKCSKEIPKKERKIIKTARPRELKPRYGDRQSRSPDITFSGERSPKDQGLRSREWSPRECRSRSREISFKKSRSPEFCAKDQKQRSEYSRRPTRWHWDSRVHSGSLDRGSQLPAILPKNTERCPSLTARPAREGTSKNTNADTTVCINAIPRKQTEGYKIDTVSNVKIKTDLSESFSKAAPNNAKENKCENATKDTRDVIKIKKKCQINKQRRNDVMILKQKVAPMKALKETVTFPMHASLADIAIKEGITISKSNNKTLIDAKLSSLISDRVKKLTAVENISNIPTVKDYKQLNTEQDDAVILKKLLNEILQEPNKDTIQKKPSGVLVREAENNTIAREIGELKNESNGTREKAKKATASNNKQNITEASNKDIQINTALLSTLYDKLNITEVMKIINPETSILPMSFDREHSENTVNEHTSLQTKQEVPNIASKDGVARESISQKRNNSNKSRNVRRLRANPQFVIIIKRLMKEMRDSITKANIYTAEFNLLSKFEKAMRFILREIVMGKGYMNKFEIMRAFREKYPKENDDEFAKKVVEDIFAGRYWNSGFEEDVKFTSTDKSNDDEVILVETKPEVIIILDSDDEQEPVPEKSTDVVNDEPMKKKSPTKIAVQKEVKQKLQGSVSTRDVRACVARDAFERTNRITSFTYPRSAQLWWKQLSEARIGQDKTQEVVGVNNKSSQVPNEPFPLVFSGLTNQKTYETGFQGNNTLVQESLQDSSTNSFNKYEGCRNKTSDAEMHTSHDDDDGLKQIDIKNETEPEFTDADVANILSGIENLDCLNNLCENIEESETPQVTAITIMTSYSELYSLKYETNVGTSKDMNKIKNENDDYLNLLTKECENNRYNGNGNNKESRNINCNQDEKELDKELESSGQTALRSNAVSTTNVQMLPHEKDVLEHEEETIESIIKYLESSCNDLS